MIKFYIGISDILLEVEDDSQNCASLKIWWKFLPKTNKNSQILGKFGISRQILDKLSA